jgi:SAM-dependent methyltransferase
MLNAPSSRENLGDRKRTIRQIQSWSAVSLVLGVGLLLSGWRMQLAQATPEATLAMVVGGLLCLLAVVFFWRVRSLAPIFSAEAPADGAGATSLARHALFQLFLISFVSLFIEVMLIRYTSSQIRVFSFYKNVPLIGCFLGLGLGCWLGRGTARNMVFFLLWLLPLSAVLSASPSVLGGLLGKAAAFGSSEQVLGDVVPGPLSLRSQVEGQLVMAATCVATLVAVTMLFALLGRVLARAFEGVPRLVAYTINILGSLLGVLAFAGLSYARTPPWVWFMVGLIPLVAWAANRGQRLAMTALALANVVAVWPSFGETVWSPYQKLVGTVMQPRDDKAGLPPAYFVQISDVFYQMAIDLRRETLARIGGNPFPHYDGIYAHIPRPQRVLIVGSGTGNDVAAALRAGAGEVDAVDIDPAIVDMGRLHHPERPYQDPRVRVVVEDARAAFRRLPAHAYDLVVFGLLDSHTQLGISSLRLDNYVFTAESFASAERLLRPGGHIAIAAASFRPWFVARMKALLETTVNADVTVRQYGNWRTYLAQVAQGGPTSSKPRTPEVSALPTDDWPFLYLPSKRVPLAYVMAVLAMALASVIILRANGMRFGGFSAYHGHLFFLGAAFLLMEVHAVNRLALLFGTTWLVSAMTIALVLVLILLANLTLRLFGHVPYGLAYAALLASLIASYGVQPGAVLGQGTAAAILYGLLLLSPVYCAGLVFARSFKMSVNPGAALGANILGSVLGGWAEYASMAYGIRVLVLLALALYACSALALLASRGKALANM